MRPLSNPFRLWDIPSLLGLSTDQHFRLLYLPREIRDMVYRAILCDWGVQGPFRHGLTDNRKHIQLHVMTNKVETNILLASKQVYEEAKQVFLKGNQFIHISISSRSHSLIASFFCKSNIAIVASGRDSVARFKDLVVMKHRIEFYGDVGPFRRSSRDHEVDIIIMRRDLWTFARRMASVNIVYGRFSTYSTHGITIFNPLVKTPSPNFLNVTNLERLLNPYLKKLQGLEEVKVQGEIDPDFAKSVAATMNFEPPLPSPPNKIIAEMITLKSRGDESFREHGYRKAVPFWNAAKISLMAMRNRKAWPRLMETAGKDFTDQLSEVAFQIQSRLARAYLDMPEAGPDHDDLSGIPVQSGTLASVNCAYALDIGTILGTGWTPSDDQTATILYYWAKGYRLADADVHFAEDAIRRADHLRPDDEEIGSEMEKILEWKHSMGLP